MIKRLLLGLALCLLSSAAFATCPNPLVITTQPGSSPTTNDWTGNSDANGYCVLFSLLAPSSSSGAGIAAQVTSSAASNLVAKSSAGNLYGWHGTTGATAGCFMVFNATSLPSNGTVTPIDEVEAAANTTVSQTFGVIPQYFSTGITVGFSSTCGFTLTASSTAFIEAQIQ